MELHMTYSVKVKRLNHVFTDTVRLYRQAVSFFVDVCLQEWDTISSGKNQKERVNLTESLTITSKQRPSVPYDFGARFYKFPCYLRRAAIAEAFGKVSSYWSNLARWEAAAPASRGKKPGLPQTGFVYPAMYRGNMFLRTSVYQAALKVFIRNTWDWILVDLKKSDVDYILHHCGNYEECVPTLQKRGKEWFLDFVFQTAITLPETPVERILAVDLGLNSACTCSVMNAEGAVLGREFLSLPREYDSLHHAIGHIKHAQKLCARRTPRLWAQAKGVNDDIAVKTAQFIVDTAVKYDVDCIVMEHLDLAGKKRGNERRGEETKYGFVSPDRRYFHCDYQGHGALADNICFGMVDTNNSELYLQNHGWCKIYKPLGNRKYNIFLGEKSRMTDAQAKTLTKMGLDTVEDFSTMLLREKR